MDINYNLETLTGKHGGLLEVVESIISDGRLILILTDEDVLTAPRRTSKRRFLSADFADLAPATMNVKGEAFGLIRESLKFTEDGASLEKLARGIGR